MAALTEEHKRFIVTSLACFKTLRQVIADLREVYGVEASRQQVQFYDPTRGSKGKRLSKKWQHVFDTARAQFVSDTASVGVAHQNYRLAVMQRMLDDALDGKESSVRNEGFVLTLLEQGAKETGGAFTNKREHSGPGGGAIPLSVEDKKRELAGPSCVMLSVMLSHRDASRLTHNACR